MPSISERRCDGGVCHLTLDDPAHRNPIDHGVLDVLEAALADPESSVVLLSAAKGPAFCSGGDLGLDPAELARLSDRIYDLCQRIVAAPTVFMVAANGIAVGAGAQLFLAADIRLIGSRARLRCAVPSRGLVAGAWSLPTLVGRARALDILLTGRELDAAGLVEAGLSARVDRSPAASAAELATTLAALDPRYRARVKAIVAAAPGPAALDLERFTFDPHLAKDR